MTALRGIRAPAQLPAQYPSLDLLNAMFTLALEHEGPDAAGALIKEELARNPTLLGLDRLLEAQLLAAPAERRHDLELVKELVGQHIKRLGIYRCEQCGFRAKPVLLALPRLPEVGNVLAAAHRDAGRLCMSAQRYRIAMALQYGDVT